MTIDKQFVLNALLQHNYLPNQNEEREELPPILASTLFTKDLATRLAKCTEKREQNYPGYDVVEYKLTRFNGVTRVLSIPHPKAYATLALEIANNWEHLEYITENKASKIIPLQHADGRIAIIGYENRARRDQQILEESFGQQFVVHTDIANFYQSIYSHSLSWATVGFEEAKRDRGIRSKWYNKLDRALQATTRNETKGVAIGPATSNIVAEAILARVDSKLTQEYKFFRYIDDYTAYVKSHDAAERFVLTLADELSRYRLALNVSKTKIDPLPQISSAEWVIALRNNLPSHDAVSIYNAVNYLDFAVHLADRTPDGSVLKFATKSLVGTILDGSSAKKGDLVQTVIRYVTNLAFHQPIVIPLLSRLFDSSVSFDPIFKYGDVLQTLLHEHVRLRHSDAISWILYFSHRYGVPIQDCCAREIVESGDCIPMLFLYVSGKPRHRNRIIRFAKRLDRNDLYRLDQYWLLLYQLFLDNWINNPYGPKTSFDVMKKDGVTFVIP